MNRVRGGGGYNSGQADQGAAPPTSAPQAPTEPTGLQGPTAPDRPPSGMVRPRRQGLHAYFALPTLSTHQLMLLSTAASLLMAGISVFQALENRRNTVIGHYVAPPYNPNQSAGIPSGQAPNWSRPPAAPSLAAKDHW